MLQPKRTKFRKVMKSRNRGLANGHNVSFGDIGLQATGRCRMTARQIEAARRAMTRHVKRQGKIWIRVFPDKPVTKKGNEQPMGGGKGAPDHFVVVVKPGTVLYEIGGITRESAKEAIALASDKFGVKTKFIEK